MARPGYMSIQVDQRIQKIFDMFCKVKGVTKSTAVSEMLEIYMLAMDEALYLELKKEEMNIDAAREILLKKGGQNMFNDYIIMKLGDSKTLPGYSDLNGLGVLKAYIRAIKKYGFTWFSTSALHWGIAKKKVDFYNAAISRGEDVKFLFIPAVNDNEIYYSANIMEIQSSREKTTCPVPDEAKTIPPEFGPAETNKIWVKITDLKEDTSITVDMLKFRENDADVRPALEKAQWHFGYVYIPDAEQSSHRKPKPLFSVKK